MLKKNMALSWDNVNIPGFSNIVNSKTSTIKRIIWGLSITFCLVICVIQINERINFFLYSSIGVKVTIVEDHLPILPRVTICSGLNNMASILHCNTTLNETLRSRLEFTRVWTRHECAFVAILNMTYEGVWKEREILLETTEILTKNMSTGNWDIVKFTHTRHLSSSGPCITFTIVTKVIHANQKFRILIRDRFDSPRCTWTLGSYYLFYHEDEKPLIPEVTKESSIDSAYLTMSTIQASNFINLNTTKTPCVNKEEYYKCRIRCIKEELQNSNITCRFPLTIDGHVTRKKCSDIDECVKGLRELRDVLNFHNPINCKCPRKCNSMEFISTTAPIKVYKPNYVALDIILPHTFKKVEEFVAYNIVALFCDIGGSLGLCLGLCLISVMELLQTVGHSFKILLVNHFQEKVN